MEKKTSVCLESMKRGFTLVELLVVVAILGILGTIAIQQVTGHIEKANITAAKSSVDSLASAIETNYSPSKMPSNLLDLVQDRAGKGPIVKGGEGALEDPWGNTYKLEYKNKSPIVISAGPDGEFGNEDDIRSDVTKKKEK